MHLAGIDPNPCVMTDERGNVMVFRAVSGDWTGAACPGRRGGVRRSGRGDRVLDDGRRRRAAPRCAARVTLAIKIGEAANRRGR